ncbi:hypothetical protein Q7P35_007782 [Cladosporium inversicolor]
MVTRKPIKPRVSTSQAQDANPLPYPATPIDSSKIPASTNSIYSPNLGTSPAFDLIDMNEAQKRPRRDSDVSSNGTWDSPDEEDRETPEESELPQPLRIAQGKQKVQQSEVAAKPKDELPAALRPGPAGNASALPARSYGDTNYSAEAQPNPWAQEHEPYRQQEQPNNRFESNNPYLKSQPTGSGSAAWAEAGSSTFPNEQQHLQQQHSGFSQASWNSHLNPPPPSNPPPEVPVELPTVHTPADEISKMSLGGPPYPPEDEHFRPAESSTVPHTNQPPRATGRDRTESFASKDSWEQDQPDPEPQRNNDATIPLPPPAPPGTAKKAPPYPEENLPPRAPSITQAAPIPQAPPLPQSNHGHSLIDDDVPEPAPASQREDAVVPQPDRVVPAPIEVSHQAPVINPSSSAVPETPRTQARRQRNEHYSIKHISWKDSSNGGMRRSPILTQNANGPCPLLALVNALVLSTPPDLDTALIETLRTREQVSLGLLLDAVFDELMSGRRGDSAQELPDVSELYSFLLALHTGMNVNPRFITPVHAPRGSLDGHSPDLNQTHPMHRAQSKAGAFEETKEMRLYSTFSIPLIHGWVPAQDTSAYAAFERCAQSFEDAQNIQFVEFELEDKLRAEGLSEQEQLTLQDIQTIKSFLSNWPTQLTDFGLQVMSRTLKPGQIAILFRNDHFSTVYKEPTFGGLMTLVTDAGYGSHDEIVWESLVDVNGAASELFSGDFRVVSHNQDASRLNVGNSAGGEQGWQTVQGRNSTSGAQAQQSSGRITDNADEVPPPLPGPRPTSHLGVPGPNNDQHLSRTTSEQEDHDLALALQLQEEEEDRQRQSDQQRRREQELSEQYISRQDEGRPPAIPPRRGGGAAGRGGSTSTAPSARPGVNRTSANPSADPTAPPSYEQSASDRPYREGGSAAPLQQGHPLNTYDALRQQQNQQGPTSPPRPGGSRLQGRRRSSQLAAPGGFPAAGGQPGRRPQAQPGTVQAAEEKCSVM